MSKLCKYLLFTSNEIESSTIEPPYRFVMLLVTLQVYLPRSVIDTF